MANEHAMNPKQVEQLKKNLGGRDTAELLEIWGQNDRKSYTDEAFEAIRLILIERSVAIPHQPTYIENEREEKNKNRNNDKTAIILLCVGMAVIIFCALLFFSTSNIWEPEGIPIWIMIGVGVAIGVPLLLTGIILFCLGKSGKISAVSIASLVFGICGVLCLIYIPPYSLFFSIVGTVLGVIELVRQRRNPSPGKRLVAIAGLVFVIIVLIFGLLAVLGGGIYFW